MTNLICFALYAVLALFWIALLLSGGKRYGELIRPLDPKKYLLKEFYPIGFRFMELIRYRFDLPGDTKRVAQCKIVFGERFGEYYFRVNKAEKVTYVITCIVIAPLLGPLLGGPVFCLFGLFAAGIAYYYADSKITDVMKDRAFQIMRDLPDMVSKMALLINAGMITKESWEEISETGEGVLYQEMRNAVIDMKNGVSEIDAYLAFGNRCGEPIVKKFVSMLVQNLSKGNRELVDFLKAETTICWEEKKHLVKRKGEEANNAMMLPLSMIMVGVFVMILVPIVSKMGS